MCIVIVQKVPSSSNSRRTKLLTLHGNVLATLVSQTTCLLKLVLAAPRGTRKKQFLLYIPNNCFAPEDHSYLFCAVSELQLAFMGSKLPTRHSTSLFGHFLGYSHNNYMSVAHIVRSHLDYRTSALGCYELLVVEWVSSHFLLHCALLEKSMKLLT